MATPRRSALHAADLDDLPKYGVSYTRYSTEEQGSTDEQQAINEELAAEHEVTIEKGASFHDEGLSRSLSERPGLLALFDYLEEHPNVRYLMVNELERLTAGIGQRQQITSLCKRLGITIVTEDIGSIDPYDDEKMQEADERSVRSQGEVLKIRRRTKRSLRSRVRSGKSVIMRPPYGVRMVPLVTPEGIELPSGVAMIDSSGKRINSGKIEIHPEEFPHLTQMFEWSAAGVGLTEIARRLNEMGVRTKTGRGQWASSTVVYILDNPFYKGQLTWGLQETRRDEHGKKFTVVRRKGDPGRIDMESPLGAIIDADLWDRAKAQREATADVFRVGQRQRVPRQPLDGRVFCLRCGHKMYGRNDASTAAKARGHTNWVYVCHSARPAHHPRPGFAFDRCIERHSMSLRAILETLALFDTPHVKVYVVRGVSDDGVERARKRAVARIEDARAELDRAEDFALKGLIGPDKLMATKGNCEGIIAEAERQLARLGESLGAPMEPIQTAVVDGFGEFVTLIADDSIPLSVRVAALDDFGLEKVYVDKPLLRLQLRD